MCLRFRLAALARRALTAPGTAAARCGAVSQTELLGNARY
jgi:hypothetical protein